MAHECSEDMFCGVCIREEKEALIQQRDKAIEEEREADEHCHSLLARLKETDLQNAELMKILKALEWVQDDIDGAYWCPSCFVQQCQSHLEDCALGHALHGAVPPGSVKPKSECKYDHTVPSIGTDICGGCGLLLKRNQENDK